MPGSRVRDIRWRLFFLNDTATTEIYTLSLHDALPIYAPVPRRTQARVVAAAGVACWLIGFFGLIDLTVPLVGMVGDRKSTRLNSSHANISYAVFCLKKKNHTQFTLGGSHCADHTNTVL